MTSKKSRVLRMLFCDYCGKDQSACKVLIEGRDQTHICDVCVGVCVALLHQQNEQDALKVAPKDETPK
jgi:ATP-dependent protease Clp ATPase subunit